MSKLYRAKVVRVDSEGVFVEATELGEGAEWGPLELLPIPLVAGDPVIVGSVGEVAEDLILIGKLVLVSPTAYYTPPANSSFILYYENAAARTAAGLTTVSGLTTWLDDEQRLDVYTDEATAGWVSFYGVKSSKLILPSGVQIGVGQTSPSATLESVLGSGTAGFLASQVTGDTNERLSVDASGIFTWGPGNAAQDTTLKRTAVGGMRLDNRLGVGNNPDATHILFITSTASSGSAAYFKQGNTSSTTPVVRVETADTSPPVFAAFVTGDSSDRFSVSPTGVLEFGPGNASRDTNLYRGAANVLMTDDTFKIGAAGTLLFGSSGDVNLYRVDASTLATDDSFTSFSNITASGSLNGDTVIAGGHDLGRGYITGSSATNDTSGITGTSEVTVLSTPSTVWKANRAYRITFDCRIARTAGTGASFPVFNFRKTSNSGQALSDMGRESIPDSSLTFHANGEVIFTVGGSDVTAVIVQTLASQTSFTHIQRGSSGLPREFNVWDIGPASNWSNRTVLT